MFSAPLKKYQFYYLSSEIIFFEDFHVCYWCRAAFFVVSKKPAVYVNISRSETILLSQIWCFNFPERYMHPTSFYTILIQIMQKAPAGYVSKKHLFNLSCLIRKAQTTEWSNVRINIKIRLFEFSARASIIFPVHVQTLTCTASSSVALSHMNVECLTTALVAKSCRSTSCEI